MLGYDFSIRTKLLALAGIPVLAAVALASMILRMAMVDVQRTRALGSVEQVAEVSASMSEVIAEIETERALVGLHLGKQLKRRANGETRDDQRLEKTLVEQRAKVREQRLTLAKKFADRDLQRLPARLAVALEVPTADIVDVETLFQSDKPDLVPPLNAYAKSIRTLVQATASLNELSDEGELLRVITCLVAILELEERVSQEQAIVAYAFGANDFSPGTYRTLVNLVTEEETYQRMFRTYATAKLSAMETEIVQAPLVAAREQLRQTALAAVEDEVRGDPDEWARVAGANLLALREVEKRLNREVHAIVTFKRLESQRRLAFSLGLAASVVVLGPLAAWLIGRGISRRVIRLRDVSTRLGLGDFTARVVEGSPDELGQLSRAFNTMAGELERSRDALREKERMAYELEIAASIQRSLLPRDPKHPEFEFAGRMVAADEIGGDFYDVLTDAQGSLWLTVGDVSSHGVGAGIVMLMVQAGFGVAFRADPQALPDAVLRSVNRMLRDNIVTRLESDKYVTAQLLALRGDGRFVCVGAHQLPIIVRHATGHAEVIECDGPWLGIKAELPRVPLTELVLEKGDVMWLYSDGLVEARNDAGVVFDVQRLVEAMERATRASKELDVMVDAVLREVAEYSSVQDDDRTLLVVRRKSG